MPAQAPQFVILKGNNKDLLQLIKYPIQGSEKDRKMGVPSRQNITDILIIMKRETKQAKTKIHSACQRSVCDKFYQITLLEFVINKFKFKKSKIVSE